MTDMTTTYLGLKLNSPIVVSSNPLTKDMGALAQFEAAGAGAIVLPSLFEEQIEIEDMGLLYSRLLKKEEWPDNLRRIPDLKNYNGGVGGYLALVYEAKRTVNIPVIASLNATSFSEWSRYPTLLESVGADAIELNIYYLPTNSSTTPDAVEKKYVDLVKMVKANCTLPVAVKIHPYFNSLPYMAKKLSEAGADAIVLFNRFYQPDIDLDIESVVTDLQLSNSAELRERLRWTGILYNNIETDLAVTGGVHSGEDALKAIMTGANAAMVASAVLKHGPTYVSTILDEMRVWLVRNNYDAITPLIGKLSRHERTSDAYVRANYIQELSSYSLEEGE